jgi:hypothetical protein
VMCEALLLPVLLTQVCCGVRDRRSAAECGQGVRCRFVVEVIRRVSGQPSGASGPSAGALRAAGASARVTTQDVILYCF